jgi:ribosomal protein S18 acetylase RimI-like enzyme
LIEKFDRTRHNTEEIRNLLSMAIGYPSREFLQKLPDVVYDITGHVLYLNSLNGHVVGIIGLDITPAPHAWVLHLAVHPDHRKKGIGKNLIERVITQLALKSVALETDQDAVGFYRACGFNITEIISKWPGVHRYRCTKGQPPKSMLEYLNKKIYPKY